MWIMEASTADVDHLINPIQVNAPDRLKVSDLNLDLPVPLFCDETIDLNGCDHTFEASLSNTEKKIRVCVFGFKNTIDFGFI